MNAHQYVCDCMMGVNSGIPCRHLFALLRARPTQLFTLGMIRARYASTL
jgi:hypothetical protein